MCATAFIPYTSIQTYKATDTFFFVLLGAAGSRQGTFEPFGLSPRVLLRMGDEAAAALPLKSILCSGDPGEGLFSDSVRAFANLRHVTVSTYKRVNMK